MGRALVLIAVGGLAACSGNSGGTTTGGACVEAGAACGGAGCCAGLSCLAGLCLNESGSGPGTSATSTGGATTSSGATTTSGTHGSTTSGAAATSGASSSSSSTASSTTTTSSTTGTGATTSGGATTSTSGSTSQPYAGAVDFVLDNSVFSVGAAFGPSAQVHIIGSCPSPDTLNGSCCYQPAQITAANPVSAGNLTFSDGTALIGTLAFSSGYTTLSSGSTATVTWAAGDPLEISASGDSAGISAFAATVAAPPLLTGVSLALSATSTVDIARADDLTVTWTVNGSGSQAIFGLDDQTTGATIVCFTSDSDGTVTVPAALLGLFNANDIGFGYIGRQRAGQLSPAPANADVTVYAVSVIGGDVSFQ